MAEKLINMKAVNAHPTDSARASPCSAAWLLFRGSAFPPKRINGPLLQEGWAGAGWGRLFKTLEDSPLCWESRRRPRTDSLRTSLRT